MDIIKKIESSLIANQVKKTIVFPEGQESKIQQVATYLVKNQVGKVVLIFKTRTEVPQNLDSQVQVVCQDEIDLQPFVDRFLEIRKDKATPETALTTLQHPNYLGALLVEMNHADAMLSGLTYTTADTIRPALQIIKTKPGTSLATTAMIAQKNDEMLVFADCALVIKPTSEQLADITKTVVQFTRTLGINDPQASLLSYSTNGSGHGEDVERVVQAVQLLKTDQSVDFIFDGEMQFDAAYDQEVRAKKFPGCKISKPVPDVFIFPEIQSANIGYKIAQRLGGYKSVGPLVLGLNQPVNDLSRGATVEDIIATAIMTLHQAK